MYSVVAENAQKKDDKQKLNEEANVTESFKKHIKYVKSVAQIKP